MAAAVRWRLTDVTAPSLAVLALVTPDLGIIFRNFLLSDDISASV